jgi:hypothetical protein
MDTTVNIIPAPPNYEMLRLGSDRQWQSFPVVAFVIYATSGGKNDHVCAAAVPVGIGWRCSSDDIILRNPDGSIRFVGDRTFSKEQEAQARAYAANRSEAALEITKDGIHAIYHGRK